MNAMTLPGYDHWKLASPYEDDADERWLTACGEELDALSTAELAEKAIAYGDECVLRDFLLDTLTKQYAERRRNLLIRTGLWRDRSASPTAERGQP